MTMLSNKHQGQGAVDEVAQTVGEVLVIPGQQPLFGEVGVAKAGDVAEQPPTQRVGAVAFDQLIRVDRVAGALGDLGAVHGEALMDENGVG
jgi:hypothetical protein